MKTMVARVVCIPALLVLAIVARLDAGVLRHVDCDFDGDGRSDPTVYQPEKGLWYSLLSSGTSAPPVQWGWKDAVPVPADYDGDGKTDYAVYHKAAGNWYILRSSDHKMMGNGPRNWGWSGALPAPADYDGDGRADLAVMELVTNRWYVLQSSNNKMLTGGPIQLPGHTFPMPCPADMDGDAKADLVAYNAMVGVWDVRFSGSGQLTNFGTGGSVPYPAPSDYTCAGQARAVVFGPASGNWYNTAPTTGYLAHATNWSIGTASLPVPGDYDGDQRADLAVYNLTNGVWHVQCSGSAQPLRGGDFQWGWRGAVPVHPTDYINRYMFSPSFAVWWEAGMSSWL